MTSLLSDPLFHGLPPTEKIEAVKAHAQTILANSQSTWTGGEVKRVAGLTAVASALTLAPLLYGFVTHPQSAFKVAQMMPFRYKALGYAAGMATAVGGIYMGLENYLDAKQHIDGRAALRQQLTNYVQTGDESYAVQSLSGLNRAKPGAAMTAVRSNIRSLMPNTQKKFHEDYTFMINDLNNAAWARHNARQASLGNQGT